MSAVVVRNDIVEAQFGLYTEEEIVDSLSVCKITSPICEEGKDGGLYDARMGAITQQSLCVTCGSVYVNCPGHPGHIELDLPVYNPILFGQLFKLLRSKCAYCHKFRISVHRVRCYLVKLKLIEMGDLTNAESLQESYQFTNDFDLDGIGSSNSHAKISTGESKTSKSQSQSDVEAQLSHYESAYNRWCSSRQQRLLPESDKAVQQALIDEFIAAIYAAKKCENCGLISPSLRKDGSCKIFQKPPSKRSNTMATVSALETIGSPNSAESKSIAVADDEAEEDDDAGATDEDDDDDTTAGRLSAASSLLYPQSSGRAKSAKPSSSADGNQAVTLDKYLAPTEVEAQLRLLWQHHREILDFIWGRSMKRELDRRRLRSSLQSPSSLKKSKVAAMQDSGNDLWKIFFLRAVLVPPNRYRPIAKIGEETKEHPQNVHLTKIIESNMRIRLLQHGVDTSSFQKELIQTQNDKLKASKQESSSSFSGDLLARLLESSEKDKQSDKTSSNLSKLITTWIDLQNAVNCYMDSAKDPNPLNKDGPAGIRQLLEKKEGLFRKHMMGKRVNFCCRSVISPDPYIGTNEIGIPMHFASQLNYPTHVNVHNVKYLRNLVERGPTSYPGANQIEMGNGQIINLERLTKLERAGKAKMLLSSPGVIVHRHLVDGDVLLVNRQPTLHRAGIMAHKARILRHVREQTLRLSYANCSSYNADFDGDEMNCHFMQNELARAEANVICNTDNQYIVPTSGNPVRGLIQDHVASGVKLTCKDTFLNRAQYQQLLYVALSGLPGTEITTYAEDIRVPMPTVFKPERLWTGKQVISALIIHLCPKSSPQLLHLDAKTKTPASAFGEDQMEHEMIIRHGELLTGVLDKGAIGNTSMGLVHAVFELYGAETAGKLLNALGRLLTFFLQDAGQSCGIQDLVLNRLAEEQRVQLLQKVSEKAVSDLDGFLPPLPANHGKSLNKSERKRFILSKTDEINERVNLLMSTGDRREAKVRLDGEMQKSVNETGSKVIKACIPNGLQLSFQLNNFSMMVLTGAKGSAVNQSQISCLLGQQALEGQRVPIMISGKSLPSFKPYDASPRAGGFVRDRFLTGVKPQEYYFHCMAGREGLVDTAVKTSRSGYLQRCLVKHLEELKVHYDFTVRDSSNAIVQFNYGEDGLDPTLAALLGGNSDQMLFLARNCKAIAHKHGVSPDYFAHEDDGGLQYKPAQDHHSRRNSALELVKKAATNRANGVLDLFNSGLLTKGSVVRAKRKVFPSAPWSRGNLLHHWETATVTKVRSKTGQQLVDLEYVDGHVEKKVPICLWIESTDKGAALKQVPVFLLRPGLPDPAMSYLPLGNTVGACSEMIQQAVNSYIEKNPHGVITAEESPTAIHAKSLEMLVWVKYMRSLASPGDAVGCIAAQSVGEPSTQMTLNTFHLAGHGGANVTLGIPRLREIIMTASKTLKTPTMTIPLFEGKEGSHAKLIARKLCELPLLDLLDHRAGIIVKEEIVHSREADNSSPWQRQYAIRLVLENLKAIFSAFEISFEDILHVVKSKFSLKLQQILRSEQRKVGEKSSGKTLDAFKSNAKVNDEFGRGRNSDKDSEAGDNDAGGEEGGDHDDDEKKSTTRAKVSSDSDDSSDEEDAVGIQKEEEEEEDDTRVNKEGQEYENDLEDDDDELVDSERGKIESDVEADDDDDEETEVAAPSKKTARKKGKTEVSPSKTPRRKDSSKLIKGEDLNFNHEEGWIEIVFTFPAAARRLLMAPLAEKAAQACMVRSTPNIKYAYVLPKANEGDDIKFVTDGVNFEAIWSLSDELVDMNSINCNDIWRISQTFGIEAARLAIVKEIKTVFGAYGINVNARHLSLIADFMTRRGTFSAMNRAGMNDCPSPYLQMSFETTCTFLTKAAIEGARDSIQSPSASIVMGSVAKVGTGCFDLMVPLGDH